MDAMTNWDDLVASRIGGNNLPSTNEDMSYYYQDYKDFGDLFDEALTTFQDLDVPQGYTQAQAPPQRSQQGNRSHSRNVSHMRHSKKPSGTAIFGFLDHNRELSLGGFVSDDVHRMLRPPQDKINSISPSQLSQSAQPAQSAQSVITNEQLDFNFDSPFEECKPIELKEEDEDEIDEEEAGGKDESDIIVTNSNPKSYKFPPDPPSNLMANSKGFESLSGSSRPLQPICHTVLNGGYSNNLDSVTDYGIPKSKRYVPLPVREPIPNELLSSPSFRPHTLHAGHGPTNNNHLRDFQEYSQYSPSRNAQYMGRQGFRRYDEEPRSSRPDALDSNINMNMNMDTNTNMNTNMRMNMKMNDNVYLPPPSVGSSCLTSPEPRSPSPQRFMSPSRKQVLPDVSPMASKRILYDTQFFSDQPDYYHDESSTSFSSSPIQDILQSSPIRQRSQNVDTQADDTIMESNDTIVQLTPLKNNAPITPSSPNRITLQWSPVISPNGKAIKDVRKVIQELSPKRVVKKTSLLPPGELDKYWKGPDGEKNYVCVYKDCGKKFTRRYNVRSHIQTHLSDRPFTCTYCPKSFVRQHDLNRHVKSHTASKYCKCKCGREFTRAEGYKKHLAMGVCTKKFEDGNGGISKPGNHRIKQEPVLDGSTSNRLTEELDLFP